MKYNYQILSTLLAVFITVAVTAAPVTRQQAVAAAESFLSTKGKSLADKKPVKYITPIHNQNDEAFFVFNAEGGGFIVISGDDSTPPVLGYGMSGSFDENDIPHGLRWLLQYYQEQIQCLRRCHADKPLQNYSSHDSVVRHNIEPLLSTLWNQGYPYNLLCPNYYNLNGSIGDVCATGCVATAIAQVMAYHKYPEMTLRSIPGYLQKFQTDEGEKSIQLRNIPAHSVIDWDNMLDNYSGDESEEEKMAVAQLMYWVGLGCKMDYGPSSGAGFPEGVKALVRYFGYDGGTHIESRANHTIQSWRDLLYNELLENRPVAFAGTNSGGAHAFVIDGYDVDGFFHVNWGWGGMNNGFFRIEILDPDSNGAEDIATVGGYSMGQDAIIGLKQPDDIDDPETALRLTVNDWEIRDGNVFFANYINWSGVSADWNMGIASVDENGDVSLVGSFNSVYLNPDYYIGNEFTIKGLQEGSYRIVPVSKRSSDQKWQMDVNPDIHYVNVVVDAQGNMDISLRPVEDVEVTDIALTGNHKVGDSQLVCASFQNHGDEYYHEIHLFASINGEKGNSLCRMALNIAQDGSSDAAFCFTPDKTGDWTFWLTSDSKGEHVLATTTAKITSQGLADNNNLRFVSLKVNNRSDGNIIGQWVQGRLTVLNQSSDDYEGTLRLWLFKLSDDGYFYGNQSQYITISAKSGSMAQTDFLFDNLDMNAYYCMSILYDKGGDIQDGGLKALGWTQKGVVCWKKDNTLVAVSPSSHINVPSNVLAVDMSSMGSMVSSIRPNSNPNTLYILDKDAPTPDGLDGYNIVRGNHAENVILFDGWDFLSPLTFTADFASFQMSPVKGKWQSVALPFTATQIPEGIRVMQFAEVGQDGMPDFSDIALLTRNIPCIISACYDGPVSFTGSDAVFSTTRTSRIVVGNDEYRFIGTTLGKSLSNVLVVNEDGNAFVRSDSDVEIDAFKAYFTASNGINIIPLPEMDNDSTPNTVTTSEESQVFYNLNGQRVANPQKGVYINNHRKIVLR